MSLTRGIPNGLRNILDAIKSEVPRPRGLPTPKSFGTVRRLLRWARKGTYYCPMGFLKDAPNSTPACEFRTFSSYQVTKFARWWDDQEDSQAAVDAVWGVK